MNISYISSNSVTVTLHFLYACCPLRQVRCALTRISPRLTDSSSALVVHVHLGAICTSVLPVSLQLSPDTEKLQFPLCLSNRHLGCLLSSLFIEYQYSPYLLQLEETLVNLSNE